MSIPKAAGIETEYGIIIWGDQTYNPFVASQLVLNAYQQVGGPAIPMGMYYNPQTGSPHEPANQQAGDSPLPPEPDEPPAAADSDHAAEAGAAAAPGTDTAPADGASADAADPGDATDPADDEELVTVTEATVLYGLGSLMLANGSRYYIDHAHPEYCTAETIAPRQVVAADKAGERLVERCLHAVNRNGSLPAGQQLMIYKNNSDQKGNSYGCHENYLLSVDLFEDLLKRRSHLIYRYLLPFMVSRVIICGAGKVGYENNTEPAAYQLSQRADFFEMVMGLQTTYRRPLFNTRDESHSDGDTFRRLHVILGDANMSEVATYLKIGTTQLVLHMIEDGFLTADLTLCEPLDAFRAVSRDLSLNAPLALENGTTTTALALQETYLAHAEEYLRATGGSDAEWDVWHRWQSVLAALRAGDRAVLATQLDWAIKKNVLDRYLAAQGTDWDAVTRWQPVIETSLLAESTGHPLARMVELLTERSSLDAADYDHQRDVYFGLRRLDLEYHDIRSSGAEAGLFYRLQARGLVERLLTDAEIDARIATPPPDTRAWLRGSIVGKFHDAVVGADWSYVRLRPDHNAHTVYRLDFPNPLVGTAADLGAHWDRINTPEALFAYFQGQQGQEPVTP